jgi:hypothetical protein
MTTHGPNRRIIAVHRNHATPGQRTPRHQSFTGLERAERRQAIVSIATSNTRHGKRHDSFA